MRRKLPPIEQATWELSKAESKVEGTYERLVDALQAYYAAHHNARGKRVGNLRDLAAEFSDAIIALQDTIYAVDQEQARLEALARTRKADKESKERK